MAKTPIEVSKELMKVRLNLLVVLASVEQVRDYLYYGITIALTAVGIC